MRWFAFATLAAALALTVVLARQAPAAEAQGACNVALYDLNGDGRVNPDDRRVWENWWDRKDARADLNGDGRIHKYTDFRGLIDAIYGGACGSNPLGDAAVIADSAEADGVQGVDGIDSLARAGGPDTFGYTFKDSAEGGCPVNFDSIIPGAPSLGLTDDSNSAQALGFTFPFYGTDFTTAFVGSNGFITFGVGSNDFTNDCPIPSTLTPNNAAHGLWDDLLPNAGANVHAQAFPAGQCPGNRVGPCFVAQWNNVPFFGGGGVANFQIVLRQDGVIEYQYQDVTVQPGTSASIGTENAGGTVGLSYSCNASISPFPKAVYILPPLVTTCQPQRAGGGIGVSPNDQLACQVHLPILNFQGADDVCRTWIEVQYLGGGNKDDDGFCEDFGAKAVLVTWGEPGFCPPQAAGPLKVECTGLLVPGASWMFSNSQVPTGSKSGILFKFTALQLSDVGLDDDLGFDDVVADLMCEELFFGVVGDADDYRRFKKAYNEGGTFRGIPQDIAMGRGALAVEVLRKCPGDLTPGVDVTSKYNGIAGDHLGRFDNLFGGFGYYVPLIYADKAGLNTVIYIQNGGLECSSIEIWFKAQDDCLRARICDITTLAPGETYQYDATDCVGPDWQGSAWIRSSEPMGIAVDIFGRDVLMTYVAEPAPFDYVMTDAEGETTGDSFRPGNRVAFGPLIYSEYQGWDTGVQVQNMSQVYAAKVKVYFLDRSGDIITTLVDWICPRGSQTFFLPVVHDLPGSWVGSVRVESQDWWTPGSKEVAGPDIVGVVTLLKYSDAARTETIEALAYELLPEHKAYIWQVGSQGGGLFSGVGLIAIPSILKDLDDTAITSEIAIMNIVEKPGFTDFAIYIYDQNGLLDFICQKLHDRQVEYIDLQTWGYINPGFIGSAIISATFWEHDMFGPSPTGQFVRNLVGLGAVNIERSGTRLGENIPGDEAAGARGIPFASNSAITMCFLGFTPICPGQPQFGVNP